MSHRIVIADDEPNRVIPIVYMIKPFSPRELVLKVRELLERA